MTKAFVQIGLQEVQQLFRILLHVLVCRGVHSERAVFQVGRDRCGDVRLRPALEAPESEDLLSPVPELVGRFAVQESGLGHLHCPQRTGVCVVRDLHPVLQRGCQCIDALNHRLSVQLLGRACVRLIFGLARACVLPTSFSLLRGGRVPMYFWDRVRLRHA